MLIIPETENIFVLPPRTGSTTLHHAVRDACPASFLLYRHAERDAIPAGYGAYKVGGFVRHPLTRMWSLYQFLCCLDPVTSAKWAQEEVTRHVENMQSFTGFEDWLLHNKQPFLPPNTGHPGLYQTSYRPETRRSQWEYLRPDLGTQVFRFQDLPAHMSRWGLTARHDNKSHGKPGFMPPMTPAIQTHLETYMAWELALGLELV